MTVNGSASGVVVGEHPCGWMVRLDSGKEVVVYDWEVVQRNRPSKTSDESPNTFSSF